MKLPAHNLIHNNSSTNGSFYVIQYYFKDAEIEAQHNCSHIGTELRRNSGKSIFCTFSITWGQWCMQWECKDT